MTDYRNKDFKKAKEYARLITIKGGFVSVVSIRLFDGHNYNWHQSLIVNGVINIPTDQTYDYKASYDSRLSDHDEIWFDGVCIYKKSLWRKALSWISFGVFK